MPLPFPFTLFFLLLAGVLGGQTYDLVIRDGIVYDGSGGSPRRLNIGIKDGRMVRVDLVVDGQAARTINARGLAVAPGFIDLHAHLEPLPLDPPAQSHVRQGVTTALGGPDGAGPLALAPYLDSLVHTGIGLNVGYLIGHNTVRSHVMGLADRPPTADELEQMKHLIEQGMKDGAFGISTGLKYLPGAYAGLDEVVALSEVAAEYRGIYTSHLREEGLGLLEGVAEAIAIADRALIPVVLTHHKVVGQPMWGASARTLAMVDSARNAGLDVMIDQYPYTASHTGISILIPAWAMEDDPYEAFARRCADPVLRDSIKRGILFNLINDRGGNDLRRVQFSRFGWKPELEGKTLYDWAAAEGMEPTVENGAELVIRAQINGGANCIFHAMDEADVRRIMRHPATMIASDGRLSQPGRDHPHPRAYGTFPRVLGHYVREEKVLKLEEAVHKMTGLPAKRLGLTDRGLIRKDFWADIVIFDPGTIGERATFQQPHQYPRGIEYVIVNGVITVDKGEYRDVRAGQVLRGPGFGS